MAIAVVVSREAWMELPRGLTHAGRIPTGLRFALILAAAAVLPLLAAKQRPTDRNDWMTTDSEIACPDPNCSTRLRITRLARRRFSHAQTTAVPLDHD